VREEKAILMTPERRRTVPATLLMDRLLGIA
jgi:hypothetical protein